jgi:hypothetical protein
MPSWMMSCESTELSLGRSSSVSSSDMTELARRMENWIIQVSTSSTFSSNPQAGEGAGTSAP